MDNQVNHIDNQIVESGVTVGPGWELPLLLLTGFRDIVDELHARLRAAGYDDVRPIHGFALQAIAAGAGTAAELGRSLGVSKQAAGKTIDRLRDAGYVGPAPAADGRRKAIMLTERGWELLRESEHIFEEIQTAWAERLGAGVVTALKDGLRELGGQPRVRLDAAGWLGG